VFLVEKGFLIEKGIFSGEKDFWWRKGFLVEKRIFGGEISGPA